MLTLPAACFRRYAQRHADPPSEMPTLIDVLVLEPSLISCPGSIRNSKSRFRENGQHGLYGPMLVYADTASVGRTMDGENERIGLQEIIDKAIEDIVHEAGDYFELDRLLGWALVSIMRGAGFRGAELEVFSVGSSPMAVKANVHHRKFGRYG